jgi:hypothetical protein
MNPKSVNDLDPKLKETYERIMGTNFASTPLQNPTTAPTQNQPIMQTQPVTPQNQETQSPNTQPPNDAFSKTPEPPVSLFTQNGPVSAPQKKKLNVLPILIVFGGIIFFVVYIIVWGKVFGLF